MADMSAAAVTARLKQASELASLCLKLSRAKPAETSREHDTAQGSTPVGERPFEDSDAG